MVREDKEGEKYIMIMGKALYLDKPKDDSKGMEITPMPWEIDDKGLYSSDDDRDGYIVKKGTECLPDDLPAIYNAVNQTYGKGFDPSKMEELYKALEGLCKEIHLGKLNIRKDFSLINAHAYANKVLHNAKTIKP